MPYPPMQTAMQRYGAPQAPPASYIQPQPAYGGGGGPLAEAPTEQSALGGLLAQLKARRAEEERRRLEMANRGLLDENTQPPIAGSDTSAGMMGGMLGGLFGGGGGGGGMMSMFGGSS